MLDFPLYKQSVLDTPIYGKPPHGFVVLCSQLGLSFADLGLGVADEASEWARNRPHARVFPSALWEFIMDLC